MNININEAGEFFYDGNGKLRYYSYYLKIFCTGYRANIGGGRV